MASIKLWDVRIMNDNVTETNSEAVEATNEDNGAVSYYYNDVNDNGGLVVLPSG